MRLDNLRRLFLRTFSEIKPEDFESAATWSNRELDERWCADTLGREEVWGKREFPILVYELVRRIVESGYRRPKEAEIEELPDDALADAYFAASITIYVEGFTCESKVTFGEIFTYAEARAIYRALRTLYMSAGSLSLLIWCIATWAQPEDRWRDDSKPSTAT